jgi:hypothetical protein
MGFLRLATNSKVFPLDALPMNQAWQVYDEMLSDYRVAFAEEPNDLEPVWRNSTQLRTYSTNVGTGSIGIRRFIFMRKLQSMCTLVSRRPIVARQCRDKDIPRFLGSSDLH